MSQSQANALLRMFLSQKAKVAVETWSSSVKATLSVPARTWWSPEYFQSIQAAFFSRPEPLSESKFSWRWKVMSSQKTWPWKPTYMRSISNPLRSRGASSESVSGGVTRTPFASFK